MVCSKAAQRLVRRTCKSSWEGGCAPCVPATVTELVSTRRTSRGTMQRSSTRKSWSRLSTSGKRRQLRALASEAAHKVGGGRQWAEKYLRSVTISSGSR